MSDARSRHKQSVKLHSVAIDVPVGVVGVLRSLFRVGEGMNLAIEACVVAVFVAEEIGREKRVVDTCREDGSLLLRAAFDGDAVEEFAPGFASLRVNLIEVEAGDFFFEVSRGAASAHKGDADF